MKHTKGPWKVMPTSNKKNGSSWRDIVSGNGLPFDGAYIGEALEQDAHLIAAAPEMLADLERALSLIEYYKPKIDNWSDEDDFHHGCIIETIKKAKGGV